MLRRTPGISFIDLRKRSPISLPLVEIVHQKGRVSSLRRGLQIRLYVESRIVPSRNCSEPRNAGIVKAKCAKPRLPA